MVRATLALFPLRAPPLRGRAVVCPRPRPLQVPGQLRSCCPPRSGRVEREKVGGNLCDPMGCSPPGSSVHGIFQARVLEWVAIFFSRGSSQPRDRTRNSHTAGRHFNRLNHQGSPLYLSVQFSRSVVSASLRPHESQRARPPCPSRTPGVHSDSRPSSQ